MNGNVLATNPNAVLVLYMMGQSNLWGQGAFHSKVLDPQYSTEPANTFIWSKIAGTQPHSHVDDGEWVPLTTGFGFQNPPGSNPDSIGSELQIAHRFRGLGRPLYIIKTARGGTSIATDPDRMDWSPDSVDELYDVWRDFYHSAAIRALYAQRKSPHLLGVFWAQGAGDAAVSAPPGAAKTYQTNLVNLMQRIREDIGVGDAPFALQRETDLDPVRFPRLALVRAAQVTVGNEDPRAITFKSDTVVVTGGRDLFEKHDGEHFTGNGQVDMGNEAAGQLIRLTTGATLRPIPRPPEP